MMGVLRFKAKSSYKSVLKLSALSMMVALSGCGKDSNNDSSSFLATVWNTNSTNVNQVHASGQVFGPIAAATLMVTNPTDANNINLFVEENKTDSNGKFTLANKLKTPIKADSYYLLSAYQGKYLDVNGDGVIDNTSTDSKGIVSGLVKGSQLEKNTLKLSLLTDIAWRYSKYHINDFSSQDIETRLTDIANVFFTQDISGDNVIDDKDLLAFDPTNSTHLQRLSFNYSFLFNQDKGDLINAYLQGDDAKIDEVIDSLFGLYLSRYQSKDARSNQVKIEVLPFGKGSYASTDGKITYKSDGSIKVLSSFYDKKNDFVTITANPDTDTQILDWSGCYSVSEDKTKCQVSTLSDTQVVVSFGYKEAKIVDNYVDLSRARSAFDGDSKIHVTVNHGDDELVTKMRSLQQGYFVTGMAEYGYLRKVTAITKLSDYKYTLETEEATLDEVVLQGTGVYSKQITAEDLAKNIVFTDETNANKMAKSRKSTVDVTPATPIAKPVTIFSPHKGIELVRPTNPKDTTFTVNIGLPTNNSGQTAKFGGGLETKEVIIKDPETGREIKLKGTLNFDIKLDVGAAYGFGGIESLKVIPELNLKQKLEVFLGGELELEKACQKNGMKDGCETYLFTIPIPQARFLIGLVPVWFDTKVDVYVGVDGKVTAKASTGVSLNQQIKAGLVWNKNLGLNLTGQFNHTEEFNPPNGEISLEITPYISPKPRVLFFSVSGPVLPIKGYARVKAELGKDDTNTAPSFWKNNVCLGGIDVSAFLGAESKLKWEFDIKSGSNKLAQKFNEVFEKAELEIFKAEWKVYEKNFGGKCDAAKAPPKLKVVGEHIQGNVILGEIGTLVTPYVISNVGGTVMDWKLDYIPDGVLTIKDNKGVEKTSGKLEAGESETLNIVIDKSKLNLGAYHNRLKFQNGTDTIGVFSKFFGILENYLAERSVSLKVIPAKANINEPEQFTVELFKPTIALLKWSYPTNTQYGYLVKGYRVFISEDGSEWEMYQTITDKNRHFLHVPNLLTKKTYYFAIDAYGDDISSEVVKKELFVPAIVPTGDCRAHFSGGLMADAFESSGISEVYVEDRFSEYVGPGLYPDNNQAFPKAVSTTFDGIAIDTGTKVTIYSQKDFKGEVLYEKVGPAIINNSIWRNDGRYGPPVERNWKEPLQTTYPQSVREWSVGNMHSWSSGSLMIECGYSK